jgi:hypothetical protein
MMPNPSGTGIDNMQFRSAEQAVKFAFNISERAEYARTDLLGTRGTSQDALSPMDLHAQSAMIQAQIARLHPAERDSILAMYGRGKDRSDAIRGLVNYMHPMVENAIPNTTDLTIMICHWATRRPAIRSIAKDRGVSYRKVCSWRSVVLRAWIPLQTRAINRLHEQLVTGGVTIQEL